MLALALTLLLAQAEPEAVTDPLFKLALSYLGQNEPKKAATSLEQLLQKEPDNLDAKLYLARAYRGAGQADKAKDLLDKALLASPDEPSLRAARGELARALEDYDGAVRQYQKAVELSPSDPHLHFNLAEAMQHSTGNRALAIGSYRRALELEPAFTAAKVNLAKALGDRGSYGEAKELLLAAARDQGGDAEAQYNLGVLYMRENNLVAAVLAFDAALKLNPRHAPALNNLGVALDAGGEHLKAYEAFKKASQLDPGYAEAFFNLGMSCMKLKKKLEATKAFEQALKLEPSSSSPYVQLGTLYLQQGKPDRAEEAFKKAIELTNAEGKDASAFKQLKRRFDMEQNTEAYRGLALSYLQRNKTAEAVATLKQAVGKMPKDGSARLALAEAYLVQGNLDGAIDQLAERLALQPSTQAKLDLARAYAKKRVAKQAEPLYRDVLAQEPDNRVAKMGLADLNVAMGKYADAELMLKDALKADPYDVQALARLGIMKSRMGRPNEALEPLEKAVELSPTMYDARAELALLYFRGDASNADKCTRMLSDVLIAEPRHVPSLHYLGVCLFGRGEKAKALQSFKAAVAIDPTYSAGYFSLGDFYEQDGNKDEAKKAYEVAAQLGHPEAQAALKKLGGK